MTIFKLTVNSPLVKSSHISSTFRFESVWTTVLENSQPVTGKLRFLQAVILELTTSAIPFLCPEQPTVLCTLWNAVLKQTLAHVGKVVLSGMLCVTVESTYCDYFLPFEYFFLLFLPVVCIVHGSIVKPYVSWWYWQPSSNECADSEPDWTCIYSVLNFPVIHATEAFTCAPFEIYEVSTTMEV